MAKESQELTASSNARRSITRLFAVILLVFISTLVALNWYTFEHETEDVFGCYANDAGLLCIKTDMTYIQTDLSKNELNRGKLKVTKLHSDKLERPKIALTLFGFVIYCKQCAKNGMELSEIDLFPMWSRAQGTHFRISMGGGHKDMVFIRQR